MDHLNETTSEPLVTFRKPVGLIPSMLALSVIVGCFYLGVYVAFMKF